MRLLACNFDFNQSKSITFAGGYKIKSSSTKKNVLKFLRSILVCLFLLANWIGSVSAQDTLVRSAVINAIATGNASQLAEYFDAAIDLVVPQSEGNFSKKQATQIIKFFFERNPIHEFVLEHEGRSADGGSHFIGYYHTKAGKHFRTYILMKKLSKNELIRQLKFEEK